MILPLMKGRTAPMSITIARLAWTLPNAQAFYAFTNSVSYKDARWLEAREMRGWLARLDQRDRPVLASVGLIKPTGQQQLVRLDLDGLALLDLTLLDRAGLSSQHPAWEMLDSARRL